MISYRRRDYIMAERAVAAANSSTSEALSTRISVPTPYGIKENIFSPRSEARFNSSVFS